MPKAYNLRLISINSDDISHRVLFYSSLFTTQDPRFFKYKGLFRLIKRKSLKRKGMEKISCKTQKLVPKVQGPRWWGGQIGFNLSYRGREKTTFLSRGEDLQIGQWIHECLPIPVPISQPKKNYRSCSAGTIVTKLCNNIKALFESVIFFIALQTLLYHAK